MARGYATDVEPVGGTSAVGGAYSSLTPLSIWIAILVGHMTRCILSVLRFNQGKWRGIAVDIAPQPTS